MIWTLGGAGLSPRRLCWCCHCRIQVFSEEVHCLDTILILRRALSRGRWSPSILPWLVTEDLTLILLSPLPTHLLPVPTAPFLMWMSPSQPLREGPGLCSGPLGSHVAVLLVWGQLPICYSGYAVVAFFFFNN